MKTAVSTLRVKRVAPLGTEPTLIHIPKLVNQA